MSTTKVTPMDVMALNRPTEGFLCPLTANTYDVEFLNFVVSDYETKKTIFEVGKDTPIPVDTCDYCGKQWWIQRVHIKARVLPIPVMPRREERNPQ